MAATTAHHVEGEHVVDHRDLDAFSVGSRPGQHVNVGFAVSTILDIAGEPPQIGLASDNAGEVAGVSEVRYHATGMLTAMKMWAAAVYADRPGYQEDWQL